jgi:small conductance mechanosensitive channel
MSDLLRNFLLKSVRRVVLAIGIIMAVAALGVEMGPLMAVMAGATFVIGFALQDTLGNFASGLMIMFYRPFDVGDLVEISGILGQVDSVNLVSTKIRTVDNKAVIVPNNSVWGNVITNVTGVTTRRVDMVFGIGYEDDIAKAQKVLEEIVASTDAVLKNPEPVVKLHELGDSSVNFVCRPWVRPDDYWDVYWSITRAVKERFDAEGISIPFPQRDVHVHSHEHSKADTTSQT